MIKILLETVFGISWAVYLGGALIMTLVWKPLQKYLPPGQTAIVCETMGKKYKWIGLGSLGIFGLSWVLLGLQSLMSARWGVNFTNAGIVLGILATVLWSILVYLVLSMGLKVHPSSHVRILATADDRQKELIKSDRKAAIKKMDIMLKAELSLALILSFIIAVTGVVKI